MPDLNREASMSRITLRLGQNSALNDDIDDEETQLTDTENYSQSTQMNELNLKSVIKLVSQVKLIIFIETFAEKNKY